MGLRYLCSIFEIPWCDRKVPSFINIVEGTSHIPNSEMNKRAMAL